MGEGSAEERVRVTVTLAGSASTGPPQQPYELCVPPRLAEALPAIRSELQERTSQQRPQAYVLVINGRNVSLLSPNTLLRDGDTITLIPPVAGGDSGAVDGRRLTVAT